MEYHAITISGEIGSGKSSIARALSALLPGWSAVNTGKRFREFCESKGMSIQQVSLLSDDVHREFDADQRGILASGRRVIVEGRLAGWLARDLPGVYRVWCQAPFHTRVLRISTRESISTEQALEDVKFRDQGDLEKYRRVYSLSDYRAPVFYNLVLDTSRETPEDLARKIVEQAGLESSSEDKKDCGTDIQVVEARYEDKPLLRHLLELYVYDFTEFINVDINEHGTYEYEYLDHYWNEAGRRPFLIRVDGRPAGFVLVQTFEEAGAEPRHLIAEFFVLRKYRHKNVGKIAACNIFDRIRGTWRVGQITENVPAIHFWHKVIDEYTGGNFREIQEPGWDGPMQEFQSRSINGQSETSHRG